MIPWTARQARTPDGNVEAVAGPRARLMKYPMERPRSHMTAAVPAILWNRHFFRPLRNEYTNRNAAGIIPTAITVLINDASAMRPSPLLRPQAGDSVHIILQISGITGYLPEPGALADSPAIVGRASSP